MKFSNGFWLKKEGYYVHSPAEVKEMESGRDAITVYAPVKDV